MKPAQVEHEAEVHVIGFQALERACELRGFDQLDIGHDVALAHYCACERGEWDEASQRCGCSADPKAGCGNNSHCIVIPSSLGCECDDGYMPDEYGSNYNCVPGASAVPPP